MHNYSALLETHREAWSERFAVGDLVSAAHGSSLSPSLVLVRISIDYRR